MRGYRTLIEKGWWAILLVLVGGAIALGLRIPDIRVHAGSDVLVNENDPDLVFYERTRADWGHDEYAVVCVTRADWFDADGVALLKDLTASLADQPHVSRVQSLLDVPLLRQSTGPLLGADAVRALGDPDVDFARARDELLGHTQAVGNLVSADGRSLAVLAFVDMPPGSRSTVVSGESAAARRAASEELSRRTEAMVAGVREVARRFEARLGTPVRLSGSSVIGVNLVEHLEHDLEVFGIVSLALFSLALLVFYRRPRFVLMPLVAGLLPVALILGAMSVFEMTLTIITANLPLLLFTLMLPYAIYFVERYRERRAGHPAEDGLASTVAAAGGIWRPCLFSCVTTMAGFAALTTSETKPVRDFGLMMAAGMGIGLAIVFLALPSLSRPLPALAMPPLDARPRRLVRVFERLALRVPAWIVVASALLLVVATLGAMRLSAQSKFTEYFRVESEVYQGLEYIDRRLGGTTPLEVIVTSPTPKFFLTRDGLAALDAVARYFDDVPETGNVRSLATLVDEVEKRLPGAVSMLPLIARTAGVREVTRDFANEDYTTSRVLVRLRETAPTLDRNVIIAGLKAHLAAQPELAGLEARPTGVFIQYANVLNSLIDTQRRTFLYVVGAIFLMLLVLLRQPLLAVLVLLTQVLPATVMLGVMGWCGIPLDLVTVMIASIAMGVGIDAAIQYTVRYQTELDATGDRRAALSRAHATIGRAIWIATTVIIAGFCVLLLSDFRPSMYFGLFTAIAMLMSQLAALTVLPSIFLLTRVPRPQDGGARG